MSLASHYKSPDLLEEPPEGRQKETRNLAASAAMRSCSTRSSLWRFELQPFPPLTKLLPRFLVAHFQSWVYCSDYSSEDMSFSPQPHQLHSQSIYSTPW